MATLASLSARLDRVQEQIEQSAANRRCHLLFVHPGENADEAIERQKRELGVTDEDDVRVVRFVGASSSLPTRERLGESNVE